MRMPVTRQGRNSIREIALKHGTERHHHCGGTALLKPRVWFAETFPLSLSESISLLLFSHSLSVYLSIYPSIHPSIHLSLYLSISISISIYLSSYLSIYLSMYIYIHMYISVCLPACLLRSPWIFLAVYTRQVMYAGSTKQNHCAAQGCVQPAGLTPTLCDNRDLC